MPVDLTITIDERQVRAAQERLSPARFEVAMRAGMGDSTVYLRDEVRKVFPANTGLGKGSIVADVRGSTIAGLRGTVGSPLEHVAIIGEYGRRAGSAPPPVEAIQQWAARVLGDGSRGTAFIIARAIGRRGLPARHLFSEAARRGLGTITSIFTRHLRGL